MPICFVPNCLTGTHKKRSNKEKISVFRAPKDPKLFEIWQKKIPRKDRLLSQNDRICELHFNAEDVQRFYETLLPNGIIDRLPRERARLKTTAVPVKFSNFDELRLAREAEKKNLIRKPSSLKKLIKSTENHMDKPNNSPKAIKCSSPIPPPSLNLPNVIHDFHLPDNWTYAICNNYISLLHFSGDYKTIMHRIMVRNDGQETMIFIGENEIVIERFQKFSSVEEIKQALESIEKIKACRTVDITKDYANS